MITVGGYTLRMLKAERLVLGYRRPADIETYVISSDDGADTHGQVQLVLWPGDSAWSVWYAAAWVPASLREAIASARNAPHRFEIRLPGETQDNETEG